MFFRTTWGLLCIPLQTRTNIPKPFYRSAAAYSFPVSSISPRYQYTPISGIIQPHSVIFRTFIQYDLLFPFSVIRKFHSVRFYFHWKNLTASRLHSAVCAEQAENRAAFRSQVKLIQHRFAVIGLAQPFNVYCFAHLAAIFTALISMYPLSQRGPSCMRGLSSYHS